MKISAKQQLEVRNYLQGISLSGRFLDELYDHVLTALEQQPESTKFDIRAVKDLVSSEFSTLIAGPAAERKYSRINNLIGALLFLVALATYWLTMEPTVSFWDCGEFIAASYKLQVGHQPGAPLFLMIGRLFSLLARGNPAKVAYWINFSAVLASALTVLLLFRTITALACLAFRKQGSYGHIAEIMIAGIIGALVFTFSDTFWFSAVESEVYALSCLFTALTFWSVLQWEKSSNDRWLVLIAFIIGLSIGVHLLSLLAIPAVALVYYYKKTLVPSLAGSLKAFAAGCLIVGLVQFFIVQYTVLLAAKTDLLFVNMLGLPFGSGAVFFLICLSLGIFLAIQYTIRRQKYQLNLGLVCLAVLLFGFSSYFLILIRADAKTNINLSNPDNPFALYDYLGRTNYGSTPLLYGNTFDAKIVENRETGNQYRKGKLAYEVSGKTYESTYDKNILFPRIYSQKDGHAAFYRDWLHMAEGETPGYSQNFRFFATWQLNFMYWRYFLWNFAGRQNDLQGQGGIQQGNWISGFNALDAARLGSQKDLTAAALKNEGRNVFYGIPLLLGIAGLAWLWRKNRQAAIIVLTLFFFTGLAIILYLNQDPLQPRERDYAYVGSFYAFAILTGFGVLALKALLSRLPGFRFSLMLAALCCLSAPVLMATGGWDDHDRSHKTTARDWARNYLNSCAPDAILFTNADNDTYPLWYAQEVEGIRTDVRVICMQFLPDANYINQLKKQMNRSAPLPVHMREEQYKDGVRDYLPYVDYGLTDSVELGDLMAVMTSENPNDKVQMSGGSFMNFLPTKRLKLTIDSQVLVNTHTIPESDRDKLETAMEWTFNKSYASKGDLAVFDILVHNNWKRPIYFATAVSDDTYMGLDKYLYMEGYAYRLLPFKVASGDHRDKSERTNSAVMYQNIMDKFNLSGFRDSGYLDLQSRQFLSGTWANVNTLSANLLQEGKFDAAEKLMRKSLRDLPLRNYSTRDTINRISTISNLYALQHTAEASRLIKDTTDYLDAELAYIATLDPVFQRACLQDVKIGLYVLSGLDKVTADYRQTELNRELKNHFKRLADQFGIQV